MKTLLRDGVVVFEDNRIVHVGPRFDGTVDREIDARGKLVSPGFTRRHPTVPDVPTLTEKGQPDISLSTWAELWAPGKTPKSVMNRLAQALEKTMKDPAIVSAIEKAGLQVEYNDPAATLKLVERENDVVRAAARKLGLAK